MMRFARDERGATAVEFAFVAPILFALIFMVIEGSRYMWTRQVVQQTASASVRCMALDWGRTETGLTCQDKAKVRSFAVANAAKSRISVTVPDTAILTAQTCSAQSGMMKVTVSTTFATAAKRLIPSLPTSVQSSACFPQIL